ncbi:bZIP transcription factor atfA [Aspergillus aculeatinus CBS 121060]|uniref:BZIP transcription factor n=1 Tax=Aspergillus aculeatinus CBS 121060 TaxID=1448322 RepID=A0ACD1HG13_9EURO|nr:bZIP transcription factor [Aspergillus aculeatinus CBS 121060]RAH72356.1 bZIP transcription factor [Aspergillus aculeatinus CBS 121060]
MSAVVATTISTSLPNNPSHRNSSPMDAKKAGLESEDSRAPSSDVKDSKPDVDSQTSLAPPPRPAITSATDTPDYFNSVHNPFSLEPNPFEQSFSGGGSGETPGKSILPPVAALTSPALPGTTSAGGGYGWSNSLRSGPLSPAMLAGPTGSNDYFDSIGRGFPTPNESSLRTGLTPGGGGSMFPAPSPNSQALLQQLQSGGATPSTIEFHRTALNAAKKNSLNGPTSNPAVESDPASQSSNMDIKPSQPAGADPFGHHDAADAANGLFMLAKGGQANPNQFPVANQTSIQPQNIQSNEQSLDAGADRRNSQNINGLAHGGRSSSDASDMQGEQTKPAAKGKAKKATAAKTGAAANNRRKAEDAPKGANKKVKTSNSGSTEPPSDIGDSDDDEDDMKKKGTADTKKMTDEEKRKNFLERNRVAALKCRQRKKQWLANLQAKVELFTSENDALTATVTQLREEIVNLKTLLLAHKDCPVSQAQGLGPLMMNGMATGFDAHPYNIPSQMGMQGPPIPAQGLRR